MSVKEPSYYKNRLHELDTRYTIVLNEFTKTYPKYKTWPAVSANVKEMGVDRGNLQEVQADFFQFRDNLEADIETLGADILRVNKQIALLESENNPLLKELGSLEDQKEGAVGMFDDIQLRYNQYLIGNWMLFAAAAGAGVMWYRSRQS